jgi:hypothetical protein
MKNKILIIILVLLVDISFAQDNRFKEDYFREEVNLELMKNYTACELFWSEKGISEFNGKTEIWSVCNLKNGNRFIRIESYKNETYFQELYFEKKGKLRYAKETENYNPKNGFAEMKWNCEFFLKNGKLMTNISLGHGKTEDENWNPESIIEMYKKRILELNKMKK